AVIDLVLPDSCPGCEARSLPPACPDCLALLDAIPRPSPPDPVPPGLPVPWAVTPYAGAVRALIVAHKERGRLGLVAPLGAALARSSIAAAAAGGAVPARVALVPVPSAPLVVRRRGHDATVRTTR